MNSSSNKKPAPLGGFGAFHEVPPKSVLSSTMPVREGRRPMDGIFLHGIELTAELSALVFHLPMDDNVAKGTNTDARNSGTLVANPFRMGYSCIMDDFRVYDHALSYSEIEELYNLGNVG